MATVVQFAMVDAAEGDGEFIADLATQGAWLSEPQVVGIGGLPATHKTRLRGHIRQVLLIALAPRPPQHQNGSTIAVRRFERQIRVVVTLGVGGPGLS